MSDFPNMLALEVRSRESRFFLTHYRSLILGKVEKAGEQVRRPTKAV